MSVFGGDSKPWLWLLLFLILGLVVLVKKRPGLFRPSPETGPDALLKILGSTTNGDKMLAIVDLLKQHQVECFARKREKFSLWGHFSGQAWDLLVSPEDEAKALELIHIHSEKLDKI